jgi:glycosyltransferase involved in cell wall biosynthesis
VRILFCSPTPLDARLGTGKALVEIASHLESLGWTSRLASDQEILPGFRRRPGLGPLFSLADATARFVERHAPDFDVVDYDQHFLPFARSRFAASTLLVARSSLLHHHFTRIRIPRPPGLRPLVGAIVKGPIRAAYIRLLVRQASRTMAQADLVNVNNDHDRIELGRRGFDLGKVTVVPLGLARARFESLAPGATAVVTPPRLVHVGAFEVRKGVFDLPRLLRIVDRALPGVRLRMLGTGVDAEFVRSRFPADLAQRVEVVPSFEPEALPALLHECSVGVFPSYVEGFGFGVLEMLAASLPVFAYDAPGPPMMLAREHLVPRGDVGELAARLVALLGRPQAYEDARIWARRRAGEFTWEAAAKTTSAVYGERLAILRGKKGPRAR